MDKKFIKEIEQEEAKLSGYVRPLAKPETPEEKKRKSEEQLIKELEAEAEES